MLLVTPTALQGCASGSLRISSCVLRCLAHYPSVGDVSLVVKDSRDPGKGRCVTTARCIPRDSFVCEYAGDLLSASQAARAHRHYAHVQTAAGEAVDVGCYMFWFHFLHQELCLDATRPDDEWPAVVGADSIPAVAPATIASAHAAAASDAASLSSAASVPSTTSAAAGSTATAPFGFGVARYINHSRTPNLCARVIDCAAASITAHRTERRRRRAAHASEARTRASEQLQGHAQAPHAASAAAVSSAPSGASDDANDDASYPYHTDVDSTSAHAPHYPRLCFFAQRVISAGEELSIDYGVRDRDTIQHFPWLA